MLTKLNVAWLQGSHENWFLQAADYPLRLRNKRALESSYRPELKLHSRLQTHFCYSLRITPGIFIFKKACFNSHWRCSCGIQPYNNYQIPYHFVAEEKESICLKLLLFFSTKPESFNDRCDAHAWRGKLSFKYKVYYYYFTTYKSKIKVSQTCQVQTDAC